MVQIRRTGAFTLIELLVVVAIIALLISILLPSLSAAKDQAKITVCMANQRSLGLASQYYLDENRNFFPGEHKQFGAPGVYTFPTRLRKYTGKETKIFACPSQDIATRWVPTFGFAGSSTYDPTKVGYDKGEFPIDGDYVFPVAYNGWGVSEFGRPNQGLGGHVGERGFEEANMKDVVMPTDMIYMADSNTNGVWDGTLNPTSKYAWPAKVHKLGANVIFTEQRIKWYKQEQLVKEDEFERRRWNKDHEPHKDQW
jgi:prepilin-type N-terminal cleavage/methylation domain-containing protein